MEIATTYKYVGIIGLLRMVLSHMVGKSWLASLEARKFNFKMTSSFLFPFLFFLFIKALQHKC